MLDRLRSSTARSLPVAVLCLLPVAACTSAETGLDLETMTEFGARYTAAWSSHDASAVASFYSTDGSLTVNDGEPAVGREAIAAVAQSFMTAFPDLVLEMDSVRIPDGSVEYHWTFAGTNTGPGGTGKAVRFSGYEEWTMGADGLVAESQGHFDEAEYNRQLEVGFGTTEGEAFSADGVVIRYETHGAGDPALVLVHGWTNSRAIWGIHPQTLARAHRVVALDLAEKLRTENIGAILTPGNRSLKAQLKAADRIEAAFAIILGEDEVKANQVAMRNMRDGQQTLVDLTDAAVWLAERL